MRLAPAVSTTPLVTSWDLLGVGVATGVGALLLAVVGARAWWTARRRQPASERGPAGGIGRRQLLEQAVIAVFVAALAGLVSAATDYLVTASGRRGHRYRLGSAEALLEHLRRSPDPYYDPVGGFYVVAYPAGDLPRARLAYHGRELAGMEDGFVALDAACPHGGCRVVFCRSSRFFECPCDGSRFDAAGELRRGPAQRGLYRYAVGVEGGRVVVDTGWRVPGPPPGTDTTGQPPAGPHCY